MFTFLLTLLIGIVYSTDQENCAYFGLGYPLNQCSVKQTGSFLFTDPAYAHELSVGYWCPENGNGTFVEYRSYDNLNCSGDPSGRFNIPCGSDALLFPFSYCNCDGTADACGDIGTSTITDCDTGYHSTALFVFDLCLHIESNLTNIPTNLTKLIPGIKGDPQLIRNASSTIGSCVNGEYTESKYASSDCSGDPIITATLSSADPWFCSEADCQYNGGVCSEYLTIGIECNELLPKTTKVLSSTSNTNPNPSSSNINPSSTTNPSSSSNTNPSSTTNSNSSSTIDPSSITNPSSSTNSNSSSVTDPNPSTIDPNPNTDNDDDDDNDDDIDLFDYNNYNTIEYGIVGLVGVSFITILICLIYCCCCKKSGKDDNKQFTTQSVQMYGP